MGSSPSFGVGTRDLLVADDAQHVSWLLMARPLMILWLAGGTVVELWVLLYGGHARLPGVALGLAVAAQVAGLAIGRSVRRRPPGWVRHVILLAATVAVSVALWATRGVSSGIELIYLWPVPYAFILVGRRAAVVHVAVVAAAWFAYLALDAGPRVEAGRWLLCIASLVALAVVCEHLVRSLRGSQRLLHRGFEDASAGLAFMDAQGRWIALNAALRAMLGCGDRDLVGTPVSDVIAPGERAPQRVGDLWVEVARSPVHDADGAVACWSLQFHDVSARRAAEMALRVDAAQARWADEVRAALEDDRIELYAQPLVSLRDDTPTGHELLARLRQTDGTIVGPAAFMPAVERFGLAPEFDVHVLRKAVRLVACGEAIHVNLSAHSVGRPDVMRALRDALTESGADPALLTIELTETALTDDADAFAAFGREIDRLGCCLALDDFGTGYGTLTYLASLPVSEIKIDRAFVARLTTDAASTEIVRAIVGLAAGLGTTTVAEGVEDEETLAVVRALGVDVAQGYLLGRPCPLTDSALAVSAAGR
jgi:EAL domain-containing protein (putative c-di-GMP-specific phosphodiesterase class I)/PAS domain-containing protein